MTCIVQPGHNGSIAPLRLCERLYCGGQHLVVSQFLICPLITSSLCSMIFLIWIDHTLKNDVSRLHSARVLFAMFLFLPNLFYLAFRVVMIICIYTHWHVVKMRASFHWHSCSWQHSAHGLCGLVLGLVWKIKVARQQWCDVSIFVWNILFLLHQTFANET